MTTSTDQTSCSAAPTLSVPDVDERDDLAAFTARVVRLEPTSLVRLRADGGRVSAWAATPFDTLVTRAVHGELRPSDVTVSGNELLAALAVGRGTDMRPGRAEDARWRAELPGATGWRMVEEVPAERLEALADQGIALAREHGQTRSGHGGHGQAVSPPAGLLDQTVLTASGDGIRVRVPLRCLFALSGMGFLGTAGSPRSSERTPADVVRVSANDSWLRLDARYGAVVRSRRSLLPLLTGR